MNRLLLEHAYLPGERGASPPSTSTTTTSGPMTAQATSPTGLYLGRGEAIVCEQNRIKRQILSDRRLRHDAQAA